ncbi:MAG: DUF6600 domain-containing protein, partial [Luteolibacter sp.]
MKIPTASVFLPIVVLGLASCEKPDRGLEEKLSQLERSAVDAKERQRQLEDEIMGQRIASESEAIERERALLDQERLGMEGETSLREAEVQAAFEAREAELAEREREYEALQQELDFREQELTGLESELDQRGLEVAGVDPIPTLRSMVNFNDGMPTGDYDNFYQSLGEYGSWFQTETYGYAFQPSIARDASWRPYTRGRWAFTEQGWTWVSTEPFGWACYHYGRWALLDRVGWVWVPGDEWAPAWVTWRESPEHIGWAPLPPETLAYADRSWDASVEVTFGIGRNWFSFVSYRDFGNNIQPHCVPNNQYGSIFGKTRNITRYEINGRRVFVGGPKYSHVSKEIGRPFPVHRLSANLSPEFDQKGRNFQPRFEGRKLEVVAPRMDAKWNRALRPAQVRSDLGKVQVLRAIPIAENIRKDFSARLNQDVVQARQEYADMGGRSAFLKNRGERLANGRMQVPAGATEQKQASRNAQQEQMRKQEAAKKA